VSKDRRPHRLLAKDWAQCFLILCAVLGLLYLQSMGTCHTKAFPYMVRTVALQRLADKLC